MAIIFFTIDKLLIYAILAFFSLLFFISQTILQSIRSRNPNWIVKAHLKISILSQQDGAVLKKFIINKLV